MIVFASIAAERRQEANALPIGLREPLDIVTPRGHYTFEVEIVSAPEDMRRGLMFREEVPEKTGMLFDFGVTRRISMWMKNTIVPLDMLFIDRQGKIVDIVAHTTPFSLKAITPEHPAMAVLEVPAGSSNHYGIRPGDRVLHSLFQPTP